MRSIFYLLTLFLTASSSFPSFAQTIRCGQPMLQMQYFNSPEKQKIIQENRKRMSLLESTFRTQIDTDIIYIPVVVHVMYAPQHANPGTQTNISDAQVKSQITVLNEDYNKMINSNGYNTNPVGGVGNIRFFLATKAPNGDSTSGIVRVPYSNSLNFNSNTMDQSMKALSKWDPKRYLNLWVVGNISGGILGYSYLPDDLASDANFREASDGVVIGAKYFGSIQKRTPSDPAFYMDATYKWGRTATHEVGHYLNLMHTWGDMTDCSGSDLVADTPPCADALYGCPSQPQVQCSNLARLYQDYMDYTDDNCMNIFTKGQIARMRTALRSYVFRSQMVSMANLISVGFQVNNIVPYRILALGVTQKTIKFNQQVDSLSARLLNNVGGPVTSSFVRFNLTNKPNASTLSLDTGILSDNAGVASLKQISLDVPGDYSFEATANVTLGNPVKYTISVLVAAEAFPNPFTDRINLKMDNIADQELSFSMTDNKGNQVFTQRSFVKGGFTSIQPSGLQQGTYYLSIQGVGIDDVVTLIKK